MHSRSNSPPYQALHDSHAGSKPRASGGTPIIGAYGAVRAHENVPLTPPPNIPPTT
jgi:hypothetical protein